MISCSLIKNIEFHSLDKKESTIREDIFSIAVPSLLFRFQPKNLLFCHQSTMKTSLLHIVNSSTHFPSGFAWIGGSLFFQLTHFLANFSSFLGFCEYKVTATLKVIKLSIAL